MSDVLISNSATTIAISAVAGPVKIDYLYVAGWSLWADMKIMLRTVPYMLARRGM